MKSKKDTKVVAMYLPQYHEIPENNEFWGQGFTDWVSVRKAEPLFNKHVQPKVPLRRNYYDLSKVEILRWQAKVAKEYGVYGFCFYHYWFENSKTVLETPARNLLEHRDIDVSFCFAWDNTSWVRSWSKFDGNAWAPKYENREVDDLGREYLLKLDYGQEEEWERHFEFLLPYFKDDRYIKKDGKPVFIFFSTFGKEQLVEMEKCWRKLAINHGFPGIYLISRCDPIIRKKLMDAEFMYQPITSGWQRKQAMFKYIHKIFNVKSLKQQPIIQHYDKVWKHILFDARRYRKNNVYVGGFVNYDDTPRRGVSGRVIIGGTPEKFKYYFNKLYDICSRSGKDFLFITAWNEWGEGAYLEPDEDSQYGYLDAIYQVLKRKNGLPDGK